MRLRIAHLHAAAAERPPGYVEDVLARGIVSGEWLEISPEALADLRAKYRTPGTEPPLPAVGTILRNAARAAASEVKARISGAAALPNNEIARRLDVCQSCEHFRETDGRCSQCGCFVRSKTRLRSQTCPLGKW